MSIPSLACAAVVSVAFLATCGSDSDGPALTASSGANPPGFTSQDGNGETQDTLGLVLLDEDFEGNDFRRWSGLAPASDPHWHGTGDGGAHIGSGYITTERAHSGQHAWKALVDPSLAPVPRPNKTSLEIWANTRDTQELTISAWYFIPLEYPAVNAQIMQIKAAGSGSSHKPVGIRIQRDRELIVRSGILDKIVYRTGVKAPLGRWFNLRGRFVIADSGVVEVWLDGRKIALVDTDTKDNDHAYAGVGNYVASSDYPVTCYLYIDDVRVTTPPPTGR